MKSIVRPVSLFFYNVVPSTVEVCLLYQRAPCQKLVLRYVLECQQGRIIHVRAYMHKAADIAYMLLFESIFTLRRRHKSCLNSQPVIYISLDVFVYVVSLDQKIQNSLSWTVRDTFTAMGLDPAQTGISLEIYL